MRLAHFQVNPWVFSPAIKCARLDAHFILNQLLPYKSSSSFVFNMYFSITLGKTMTSLNSKQWAFQCKVNHLVKGNVLQSDLKKKIVREMVPARQQPKAQV